MAKRRGKWGMQTRLIHDPDGKDGPLAVSPPVYQTSTFRLTSPEQGAKLAAEVALATYYTRYGNPNTKQVEILLAELEGAEAALAVGSGMAAITTALMSNLRAGDHVVAQKTHYTATLSFFAEVLPRYGVDVTQVDQTNLEAFENAVRPNARVVYTETPTNLTMDITDLAATAEIARGAGALAVTDNTFASPHNQRPLELGYDLPSSALGDQVPGLTRRRDGGGDTRLSPAHRQRVGARAGARARASFFRGLAATAGFEDLRAQDGAAQQQRPYGSVLPRRSSGRRNGLLSGAGISSPTCPSQEADDWRLRRDAFRRA